MVSIKLDEKAINAVMSVMGDEQKIKLQQAVVAAFAKRYLKDVIADPRIQSAIDMITNGINSHIIKCSAAAKEHWADEHVVKEPLKKLVTDLVIRILRDDHYTVATEILEKYGERMEASFDRLFAENIQAKLNEKLNTMVINDTYINQLINKRAHELLEEKLK